MGFRHRKIHLMSDEQKNIPSKQTSSIPLKKDTVRVTLKASDAPDAPAPTAPVIAPAPTAPVIPRPPTPSVGLSRPPSPTVPISAPAAFSVPGAPSPTASAPPPAPTIPLITAGTSMARPVVAPTIKLNAGSATGAPTVPLKTASVVPAIGAPSLPGSTPTKAPLPGSTIALPKATVQLAPPTMPLRPDSAGYTQMATFQTDDEEEEKPQTLITVLSIFGFLAACGVLAFQCMSISIWEGWDKLFE